MVKVNILPNGNKQFYIDVNLPVKKALEFIKQVKASLNE